MAGLEQLFHTFFDWSQISPILPLLVEVGFLNTIALAALAILIGLVIGMTLALMLLSSKVAVRAPARAYVDVFRGLPIILTIVLIGEGLPIAGVRPFGRNAYPYAALALGMVSGAFISEIFRSGIQSVERGQLEAARSLGMPYLTAMRLIVVPQGVRRILPALTNQFIAMIKDSSLVYLLGLLVSQRELFSIANDATAATGNLSPLVAAGVCYLIITVRMTHFVNWLDKRLREGGATELAIDPLAVGSSG